MKDNTAQSMGRSGERSFWQEKTQTRRSLCLPASYIERIEANNTMINKEAKLENKTNKKNRREKDR